MMKFFSLNESAQKKGFLIIICFIALSITFSPGFNSVSTICLLLFWLLFLPKKFNIGAVQNILLLSALFWIAILGMINTQNVAEGGFRIQQKLLLFAYPLVFVTTDFDWRRDRNWVSTSFILGVLASCLFCLVVAFRYWLQDYSTTRYFSHDLVKSIDIYPYVLALLCLGSILILLESYLNGKGVHPFLLKRSTAFLLISFFSLYIFLLSVIQIIFIWLIVLAVYAFRVSTSRKVFFTSLAIIVSTVCLSVLFVPTLNKKVNDALFGKLNTIPLDRDASLGFIPWNGIALRKAVWICSLDVVEKNLWFGTGTGDGQDELQEAYEKRQFYFASRYNRYNTHNEYLQVLVNFGMVGLCAWLISLFLLMKKMNGNWLGSCLLVMCLASMLTESLLEINKGILAMAFLLAVYFKPNDQPILA